MKNILEKKYSYKNVMSTGSTHEKSP